MAGNDKLDQRWNASKDVLVDAARTAGVDADIMVKISGFESGFNSHARPVSSNPDKNKVTQFDGSKAISSAYGYGQFLNGTWNEMIQKYGEKYGIEGAEKMTVKQTNDPAIRDNPRLQAAMLAEFTRENIVKGARLGGPDTDANVYAFHNLGDGDATRFLNAMRKNPSQRVDQVLSADVISGNPSLYGDGSRTLAESYKVMGQHMDRYEKYAQEARTMTGQTPAPDKPNPTPGNTQPVPGSSTPANKSPMADGVLSSGEKGPEVEALQKKLNALGYTDANGQKLGEDGKYGNRTKEAVQQFQLENGLKVTGIADAATLKLADKGMTRFAMKDDVLQPGERGPDVRNMQQTLSDAGLRGKDGKPLGVDGIYGEDTKAAVAAYQKANGLPETGVADKTTLVKMGEIIVVETREPKLPTEQPKSTDRPTDKPTDQTKPTDPPTQTDKPLISNPSHPDNKLYQQALSNLKQLGPSGGFKSDEELGKAAAAIATDAKASGLGEINHISRTTAQNGQSFLVAVQGDPTSPAARNAYIDYNQAVNQTVEQSSKMAETNKPAPQIAELEPNKAVAR